MKLLLTVLLATAWGGADAYTWISLLLVPITGVISWLAGKRQRNNSTLHQLQETIDMLVKKNSELYAKITEQNKNMSKLSEQNDELHKEVAEVRRENKELKDGQEKMSAQLTKVQEENAGLKRQLGSLVTRRRQETE